MKSPLSDFVEAATAAPLETQIQYLDPGDSYTFEVFSE